MQFIKAIEHLYVLFSCSDDGSSAFFCEPLFGFIGGDSLEFSEFSLGVLSSGYSLSGSSEDDVEVHTEDTGVGVVLDSEINVLVNTETEVAYLLKVRGLFYKLIKKKE